MRGSLKEQLETLRPRIEANEIKRGTRLFAEDILDEAIEKAVRFAAKKEVINKTEADRIIENAKSTYRNGRILL